MYCNFRKLRRRKATFKNKNIAEIWADCGFFQDNNTFKCFYCGVEKNVLTLNCCPWRNHYMWNPTCDFVRLKKGVLKQSNCLVCFENEKNVLFLPCRHLIVCSVCVEKLKNCVLCRNQIATHIVTFPS